MRGVYAPTGRRFRPQSVALNAPIYEAKLTRGQELHLGATSESN